METEIRVDLAGNLWQDNCVFRICKTIELESGHLLAKHPGNCKFPHGHTRSVELIFASPTLNDCDMVVDFKAIKIMMGEFLESFDHALCMNTLDPNFEQFRQIYGERIIPFEGQDPTSERMAERVFHFAQDALRQAIQDAQFPYPIRDCVRLERVRVWETSSSWAEYEE